MNVESLKSELQQVLDSDVILRKEFNELKRSLSDYRNQLIMRDEDCKRLQVTIDVLNTKLVVMERDNTTYKSELASFKELRGSIREQLDSKQTEIDTRLEEIHQLKNDLNTIAADYELHIETLKNEAGSELDRVKKDYEQQLGEMKSTAQYKESGIREEFENRLSELTIALAEQEQSFTLKHQEAVADQGEHFEKEISELRNGYESRLQSLQLGSDEEKAALRLAHESTLDSMQQEFEGKIESLQASHDAEIGRLTAESSLLRDTVRDDLGGQLDALTKEFADKESGLVAGYESQLRELKELSATHTENLSLSFQHHLDEVKTSYEEAISNKNLNYVSQISHLSEKYETRLSNAVVHATEQSSRLSEELAKAQAGNAELHGKIQGLVIHVDAQQNDIEHLSLQLSQLSSQLAQETSKFAALSTEYDAFRQTSLLSESEQATGLNQSIDQLNDELRNMGLLLESTANQLGDTEILLELKNKELEQSSLQMEALHAESLQNQLSFSEKIRELESFCAGLEEQHQKVFAQNEVEYQKLLVENTSLISEIDLAQDKIDAFEAEMQLLKTELSEQSAQSAGKAEHFKETLSGKHFEITRLEANNAALSQELLHMKQEITALEEKLADQPVQVPVAAQSDQDDFIDRLFKQIDLLNDQRLALLDEKEQMAVQLLKMNEVVGSLSQEVDSHGIDVTNLNNHRKNVILAKNLGEPEQHSPLKEQINDLVREIDKCIALLSA